MIDLHDKRPSFVRVLADELGIKIVHWGGTNLWGWVEWTDAERRNYRTWQTHYGKLFQIQTVDRLDADPNAWEARIRHANHQIQRHAA